MKTPYILALSALFFTACAQMTPVEEPMVDEVVFGTLAFTLPEGWELTATEGDHAMISVPDSNYEVTLDMYLQSTSPLGDQDLSMYTPNDEGLVVYRDCGGGICFQVADAETRYFFGIDVNSTEPVPENLDGIWVPTFDASADLQAFEWSVHLAE